MVHFLKYVPTKRRAKIRPISTHLQRLFEVRGATWLFSTLHFSGILKLRVPVTFFFFFFFLESVAQSLDCAWLISAEGRDGSVEDSKVVSVAASARVRSLVSNVPLYRDTLITYAHNSSSSTEASELTDTEA